MTLNNSDAVGSSFSRLLMASPKIDPGGQTGLQICPSSFTESCGLGAGRFREHVLRRVAVLAPSFWQDESLFWDFPKFTGFPLWALLWGTKQLGFRVQVKLFDASPVIILSGRVCFCLNDRVEAIWL